ncbi:MAG: dTDP-4-dehydrorhamnose reductase [Porticoccaceae bacterium]|nr:dTDP-4-dehydrorhamnose reductase [Porticoccaceae bacterium]
MKILLLGKNGQVGWELQRALLPLGAVIALDRHGGSGFCGDLADLDGLKKTVRRLQPDVIVNAAAYTAVDKAESERAQALRINSEAPQLLAEEVRRLGGWLVHYSTDYVFDGQGTVPWREVDSTAPINHYGYSKLLGEQHIATSGCQYLIFRTSWVYGSRGNNFAKTMLRLGHENEELRVISDQYGVPTSAELIADITAHALRTALVNPQLAGLYHLAASGETNWHDYAKLVIDHARHCGADLRVRNVVPITTAEYPTQAPRPANSRLDTSKLRESFRLNLPIWQSGVIRMLTELL